MESGNAASQRRRAALVERGRAAHAAAVDLLRRLGALRRDDDAAELARPPAAEPRVLDGQLAIAGGILRECLVAPGRVARAEEVADVGRVLHEIYAVRFGIHDHLGQERLRRLDRLDQGLAALRSVTDQDELLERVCEAAAGAGGFERVMLSRVDDETWQPWRSWSGTIGDAELAFRDWIREVPAIELSRLLLESELVERREPALVARAEGDPRVYAPMARAAGLTSYVAAPIIAGERVIGLLHADNRGAEMVDLDRDILWSFALGFAQAFERAVLLDRLREQRAQVLEAMRSVELVLDELATSTVELVTRNETTAVGVSRSRAGDPAAGERSRVLEELLTGRELEVLALMATGATNERIAHRLVIATGTVKSHVKQILRKLRVENRAEAISQYLRLTIGSHDD
ncbi:LuxR C-terminal-related transcriptional regulator [Nocardioides nitrophenolicus]|uniref:LuxR C-terminal-related transcriptional regulator n=1 Tax=Nocardioides nitrophenolicus TaxID=60489 RepID=UPI00195BC418|nr:LuxR C-terminal-related transcriptional regulator [Nocardioides nitrophenolicus]MBM7517183.1 DNA-binding CsgD family transcriptional regulator [Nocardioides nitrophenolicus]